LLDFIGKFGPLTTPGLDPAIGEPVEHTLKYAALMKRLASSYSTGRQAQMAQALKDPMVPRLPNLQASLVVDPQTRNPKIQLTVRDLLSALWLQLGQKIAGGACVRSCQKCGTLFEVGPGTGRRLDAKFCSDEHRIAYHSLNRR
jgi:hypothetical protein